MFDINNRTGLYGAAAFIPLLLWRIVNFMCRANLGIYNPNKGRNYSDDWYENYAGFILLMIFISYPILVYELDINLLENKFWNRMILAIFCSSTLIINTLIKVWFSIDTKPIYLSMKSDSGCSNGPSFFSYAKSISVLYLAMGVLQMLFVEFTYDNQYIKNPKTFDNTNWICES